MLQSAKTDRTIKSIRHWCDGGGAAAATVLSFVQQLLLRCEKFLFRRDVVFGGREFSVWGVTDGESNKDNKRKRLVGTNSGTAVEKVSIMIVEINLKSYF